jgi:hypothetical protein
MKNNQLQQPAEAKKQQPPRKPNETGSISVQAHMRIFDPKTQKTFVEGRA